MKDIFEIITSGITEFLFWERTEEYIQSDKERKRKSFVPALCFWCAVAISFGLIIVGVYEIIRKDIILGISLLVAAGSSIFYLWYRIDSVKNKSKDVAGK